MENVDVSLENLVNELMKQSKRDRVTVGGVGVLIERNGKLLVLKRKQGDFYGGYWELPGGGIEDGESVLDTVFRETKEETGLEVTKILRYHNFFDYDGGSGERVRQLNFVVETAPGEIILTEHDDFLFAELEDLPQPISKEIIETLSVFFR